jgi:hypothetical protein
LRALRRDPLTPGAAALIVGLQERTVRARAAELRRYGQLRGHERLELTPSGRKRLERLEERAAEQSRSELADRLEDAARRTSD